MKKIILPLLLKWKSAVLFLTLLSALSFSSCGYHAAGFKEKSTLSIPYVEGDPQGQLTSELARQLESTALYELVTREGDLTLKVRLVSDQNEIIGFKYDRSEVSEKIEKNLMATENRRILLAEVSLLRADTQEIAVGPLLVSASAEYDYVDVSTLRELAFVTPAGKKEKVIDFSLGQLDSVEGAQDTALRPAYRQLAQKIIGALQRAQLTSLDD